MGFSLTIPANHPVLAYLNSAYAAGYNTSVPMVISLGNIDDEAHDLENEVDELLSPMNPSSNAYEYDDQGTSREMTISGDFQGTPLAVSQWIIVMETMMNFWDSQAMNPPYVLAYTAGSFPSYPYTTWAGGTGQSYNVIVESFVRKRSSDTPAADVIYYTLKLKERAVTQ